MMTITKELKEQIRVALLEVRPNFGGPDGAFAKSWGMNAAVFSRIQKGQVDGVLADVHWLTIARELQVGNVEKKWNTAKTDVFLTIEQDIIFCKENAKSKIFVDECEIGKTYTAKYLSRSMQNCFYVDGSQNKSRQKLIRGIAKTLGVDKLGSYDDVKENIKYYLKTLSHPIIIIDEAGDLNYEAFLELKEFWNATEGYCGWYLIGADGLRAKITHGILKQKVGYREVYSRFSSNYSSAVPAGSQAKIAFYKKLISDVLNVNMDDKSKISQVINKCITKDDNDNIGGLRRAESILILNS